MVTLNDIQLVVAGEIRISEPLMYHTPLRMGGPADYFVEPATREDTGRAIAYFRQNKFPILLVRHGENLLVSDDGFRGAAIAIDPEFVDLSSGGGMPRWAALMPSLFGTGPMFYDPPGKRASRLVAAAGWGGKIRGDVMISSHDPNILVNQGGGRAEDALALVEAARAAVAVSQGVVLNLAIVPVGFDRLSAPSRAREVAA
jgi:UDP-N-acetylenolpyruvoylglucosamine reductase